MADNTTQLTQSDPALRLLAYIARQGGALEPDSSPARPSVVDYPQREHFADFDELIARLCVLGYLHERFAERLNLCFSCRSARLLIRDQCPECSGSQLADHAVLHHFRCACQAPELDFLTDEGLRCPKCRQPLQQIGFDYEVLSGYCQCRTCNAAAIQPVLGFRCLDCAASGAARDLVEQDVPAWVMTAAGYSALDGLQWMSGE